MSKKLKVEDLKIGMKVMKEQLSNIYGITVYFNNYDTTDGGVIIFIESDTNKASLQKLCSIVESNNNSISTFYQDPEYRDEEVTVIE